MVPSPNPPHEYFDPYLTNLVVIRWVTEPQTSVLEPRVAKIRAKPKVFRPLMAKFQPLVALVLK